MTNVLVAGGAGYIGSHAVKSLMKSGFTPIAFDNLSRGYRDAVLCPDFVEGDLRNIDDIRSIFKSYQIDAVMHFAAMLYVGESVKDPEKNDINNVIGGINLLSVMMESGVKRLIFSSTAAVYGEPKTTPIPESHSKDPINPYGVTKYLFERAMEDYCRAYGLKYVSLRYFNASGADPDGDLGERHNPETHLIPLTLMAAGGKRSEIVIYGDDYPTPDGTCIRDYIHITDLISAHILSLKWLFDEGGCEIFILGT
jgi:UDP-glucose 4-epimerase